MLSVLVFLRCQVLKLFEKLCVQKFFAVGNRTQKTSTMSVGVDITNEPLEKKGSLQSAEISKQSLGSDLSWKKSNIFWGPPFVTICKSSLNFEGNWLLFMLLL